MMNNEFQERLKQAFDFATMAEIARRIGVPHATVRNYFGGRMPAPEVLIKIANETHVSLNWLLIGTGEMYVGGARPLDLGKLFEEKIDEMLEKKLAARRDGVQDLGTVDSGPAFNIEAAVRKYDDPQRVMSEWFRHESRQYPKDYGVVFFQGWETYTFDEKIDAVKDAKKVLDRTLKKK